MLLHHAEYKAFGKCIVCFYYLQKQWALQDSLFLFRKIQHHFKNLKCFLLWLKKINGGWGVGGTWMDTFSKIYHLKRGKRALLSTLKEIKAYSCDTPILDMKES